MTMPALPAQGDTNWYAYATALDTKVRSSTVTNPRIGVIRVASNDAPADVKAQADYVCAGSNDQTVINTALLAASRPSDGFGGIGGGCVELVGPNFYVGNNNTGSITMYPATWLRGSGPATMIRPMFTSYTGLGCIQLINDTTDHTQLSDFTIGKENSSQSNCTGILYTTSASSSGSAYSWDTGSDSFHSIHHISVLKTAGYGLHLSGGREFQVMDVLAWDTALSSFQINASDSKFTACTAQAGTGGPGFAVAGGNSKLTGCKAYYTDGSNDGYYVTSSRAELVGCAAQDNGRYGFNVTGVDVTMSGCVADSNARMDSSGGGFLIGNTGIFEGLHAFDRNQTPASPQLRGIVFSGTPQVYLTGRVRVPSGTNHIVGSPGANSYMRVVKDGTTIGTAG